MKKTIQAVKGTRDFTQNRWLFGFGFTTPSERYPNHLDTRNMKGQSLKDRIICSKSGEELVKEQAFVFPDRGGDLIYVASGINPHPGPDGRPTTERTGYSFALVVLWAVLPV